MKEGLNNIIENFGMPESHINALQQVSREGDIVIGMRRVRIFVKTFIEDQCPAKTKDLKMKTTHEVSAVAGLIPLSPLYSQVKQKEYQTWQEQLQNAFNKDPELKSIPCILSQKRFSELKSFFKDDIQIKHSFSKNEYTLSWKKQGKNITVIARKNSPNNDYTLYDTNGMPLQVLGKEIINSQGKKILKPVTADYDLLFYFIPREGRPVLHEQEVLDLINRGIAKNDPNRNDDILRMVHHGSELQNPVPQELIDNLPALIIFPRKMNLAPIKKTGSGFFGTGSGYSSIVLIETLQELKKICEIISKNNYYLPTLADAAALLKFNQ